MELSEFPFECAPPAEHPLMVMSSGHLVELHDHINLVGSVSSLQVF